jgi:sialate O-acetylesterase
MWIDGKEVFLDLNGTNPARRDAAKVPFLASKGKHEILVALDTNKGNAWGIFLRFKRLDVTRRQQAKGLSSSQLPVIG